MRQGCNYFQRWAFAAIVAAAFFIGCGDDDVAEQDNDGQWNVAENQEPESNDDPNADSNADPNDEQNDDQQNDSSPNQDQNAPVVNQNQEPPNNTDPSPEGIESVELTPEELSLGVGESQMLSVTVTGEGGDLLDDAQSAVDWNSADESVAAVDDVGVVIGVGEGETTVTASLDGESAQTQVTVTEKMWRDVVAGSDVTCAVSMEGQLYCWGTDFYGSSGQQGQVSILNSEPVAVPLGAEVAGVTAGYIHYCAWDEGGQAYCWGFNQFGQVGASASESVVVPTLIGGASFSKVEASGQYTCGLTNDGEVHCWGLNDSGQLGRPGEPNTHTPTPVPLDKEMIDISTGPAHACAVDEDGGVHCWGRNHVGAVNPGVLADQILPPTEVSLDDSVSAVVTGATMSCALTDAAEILCWGFNARGEAGRADTVEAIVGPGAVEWEDGFVDVSLFGHSMCGVTEGHQMLCWGENRLGAVGDGSLTDRETPVLVALLQDWSDVSAGNGHSCGIDAEGELWCWGSNSMGQIGDGRTMFRTESELVGGGDLEFSSLQSGNYNLCGATDDGYYCWGRNESFQLQTERPGHTSDPLALEEWSPDELVLGGAYGCGIEFVDDSAGPVRCWGNNAQSRLGIDDPAHAVLQPTEIDVDRHFMALDASNTFACAVSDEQEIYCWGANDAGQVGAEPGPEIPSPHQLESEALFEKVATGLDHSCGLTEQGEVQCWGGNELGQLGNGEQSPNEEVGAVHFDYEFDDLGAGNFITCGLTQDGEIVCWGHAFNFTGVPGAVFDDEAIVFDGEFESLHVGPGIVCGINGGELHCAGWDQEGWIAGQPISPVQEMTRVDYGFDVQDIAIGPAYVCMLDTDQDAHCLGYDAWGVLGDGSTVLHTAPMHVTGP